MWCTDTDAGKIHAYKINKSLNKKELLNKNQLEINATEEAGKENPS